MMDVQMQNMEFDVSDEVNNAVRSDDASIDLEGEEDVETGNELPTCDSDRTGEGVDAETISVKPEEPKIGKSFSSLEEIFAYYQNYAQTVGFSVIKASSGKGPNGEHKFQTFTCHKARKPSASGNRKNSLRPKPTSRTNCKARISTSLVEGRWRINSVILEHNHTLIPGQSHILKRRLIAPYGNTNFEVNDIFSLRLCRTAGKLEHNKGGCENISSESKTENASFLRFGEGDADALHKLFLRMQVGSRDFFYAIDPDMQGRPKNVFWADQRSRAAYREFGDVLAVDTTYFLNKYRLPFVAFLGVNHHSQSMLFGCALISSGDVSTYIWLFGTWLICMSNHHPSAIITDECRNISEAVQFVFPKAHHRWCLWHILTKYPEKMKEHKKYDDLKESFLEAAYGPLNVEEFDNKWAAMVDEYDLHGNDWISALYNERERWVPVFVKDIFWAGMSSTQRNDVLHSYFDGYVHSRSSVKQFVEQFEIALKEKIDKETKADFASMNSYIRCATSFGVERQFQQVYTNNIFVKVQREVTHVMYCEADLVDGGGSILEYQVMERKNIEAGRPLRNEFKVRFNVETNEVFCSCRMFEYNGILCRHAFRVLVKRDIETVPPKYVLRRWRKDVGRCHSKVRMGYLEETSSPTMKRSTDLEKLFYAVSDIACDSNDKYEFIRKALKDCKHRLERWETSSSSSLGESFTLKSVGSRAEVVDEVGNVPSSNISLHVEPIPCQQRGPFNTKRPQSSVEKSDMSGGIRRTSFVLGQVSNISVAVNQAHICSGSRAGTQPSSQISEQDKILPLGNGDGKKDDLSISLCNHVNMSGDSLPNDDLRSRDSNAYFSSKSQTSYKWMFQNLDAHDVISFGSGNNMKVDSPTSNDHDSAQI